MDVRGLLTEGFGRITELYAALVGSTPELVLASEGSASS